MHHHHATTTTALPLAHLVRSHTRHSSRTHALRPAVDAAEEAVARGQGASCRCGPASAIGHGGLAPDVARPEIKRPEVLGRPAPTAGVKFVALATPCLRPPAACSKTEAAS
jgi:hypothetical protein